MFSQFSRYIASFYLLKAFLTQDLLSEFALPFIKKSHLVIINHIVPYDKKNKCEYQSIN